MTTKIPKETSGVKVVDNLPILSKIDIIAKIQHPVLEAVDNHSGHHPSAAAGHHREDLEAGADGERPAVQLDVLQEVDFDPVLHPDIRVEDVVAIEEEPAVFGEHRDSALVEGLVVDDLVAGPLCDGQDLFGVEGDQLELLAALVEGEVGLVVADSDRSSVVAALLYVYELGGRVFLEEALSEDAGAGEVVDVVVVVSINDVN